MYIYSFDVSMYHVYTVSFMLFAHHLMSLCWDMNHFQMFFLEASNCDRLWWKKLTRECNLFSGNCLDILCWLEGERTNLICNAKSHRAAAAASLFTVSPQQLVWVLFFHSAEWLLVYCCSHKLSVYVGRLCRWCIIHL